MRIIPEQYECEICRRRFATAKEALACEQRKVPIYPVGLIYGNHTPGTLYCDITFAVARENTIERHTNITGSWACRSRFYGDSLDDNLCGSANGLSLSEYDAKLDFEHPTFKRMIEYLESKNIPITIWNGKEPVPYNGE